MIFVWQQKIQKELLYLEHHKTYKYRETHMSDTNQNTPSLVGPSESMEMNTDKNNNNDNKDNKNDGNNNQYNKTGGRSWKQYNEQQSLHYEGKNADISGILALRNVKFNSKKVPSSVFQQRLKYFILIKFDYARDIVPIINDFTDTLEMLNSEQPGDLDKKDKDLQVMIWMKQDEVKAFIKRINTLENNKETLCGFILATMLQCFERKY
jgi:hypothetical protein